MWVVFIEQDSEARTFCSFLLPDSWDPRLGSELNSGKSPSSVQGWKQARLRRTSGSFDNQSGR